MKIILKLIRHVSIVTTDGVTSTFYVEMFDGDYCKVSVKTISPRLVRMFDELRGKMALFGIFNSSNDTYSFKLQEMVGISQEIDMMKQYILPDIESVADVPEGSFDLFNDVE